MTGNIFREGTLGSVPWSGPTFAIASPDTLATNFSASIAVGTFTNSVLGGIALGDPNRRRVDVFDNSGAVVQSFVPQGFDGFGTALAAMNIDTAQGFQDLVVGEPGGSAVLYYFGAFQSLTGPTRLDQTGLDSTGLDDFGHALALGDFNGDRTDDLAVGAPNESPNNVLSAGAVYVFTSQGESGSRALIPWSAYDQEDIGSDDSFVYALRPQSNLTAQQRLLLKANLGGSVRASAAIGPDGSLYIGSDGNKLFAFKGP